MQVSNIGLNGRAREQFTTAWFLGGDEISAATLLDMPRRELSTYLRDNKIVLGEGIGMMRNNYVLPTDSVVRIGYASNAATYHLLGKADEFVLEQAEERFYKQRFYSVPASIGNRNMEHLRQEQRTQHPRDVPEQRAERTQTVSGTCSGVPEKELSDPYHPLKLHSPEQRNKVLEAIEEQRSTSLRAIRKYAGISNETHKFRAMKAWLEMNGHTFHLAASQQHTQEEVEV